MGDVDHWRTLALERQAELDEFMESSKELEMALEEEVESLGLKNETLHEENQALRVSLEKLQGMATTEAALQERVESLDGQLETRSKELAALETEHDALQERLRQQEMSATEADAKLEEAVEQTVFLTEERDDARDQLERLRAELVELKSDIEVQKATAQQANTLFAELEDSKKTIEELRLELENVRTRSENSEEAAESSLREQVDRLASELETSRTITENLTLDLEDARKSTLESQKSQESSLRELVDSKELTKRLQSDLEMARATNSESSDAHLEVIKLELEKAQTNAAELQQKLQEANVCAMDLERDLELTKASKLKLKEDLVILEQEVQDLREGSAADKERALEDSKKNERELRLALEARTKDLNSLNEELLKLQDDIDGLETEKDEEILIIRKELRASEAEREDLKKRITVIHEEMERLGEKALAFEEVIELRDEIVTKNRIISDLRADLEMQMAEREKEHAAMIEVDQDRIRFEEDSKLRNSEMDELMEEKDYLKSSLEESRSVVAGLEQEKITLSETNASLQQTVDELKSKSDEREKDGLELAALEAERDSATQELQSLQETQSQLELDVKRHIAEKEELRKELDVLARQLEQERGSNESLVASSSLPVDVVRLRAAYTAQLQTNASLLARMQKLRGNILVCCRVRPMLEHDGRSSESAIEVLSSEEISFQNDKLNTPRPFAYDRVFGPTATQTQVCHEIGTLGIAESVVGGTNACIMAYGQTGSGKTYTMDGPVEDPGINNRTMKRIFELTSMLSASGQAMYTVRVAMVEIYNENVRDLLHSLHAGGETSAIVGGSDGHHDNSDTLSVASASTSATASSSRVGRTTKRQTKIGLPDFNWVGCGNMEEAQKILKEGRTNRSTAATNLNLHSSRSHLVIVLEVSAASSGDEMFNTTGQLYLVDLAGSERVSKSKVEGSRLDETKHINRSLAALGDVLEALDSKDRSRHVPYRNSKLTHLLQSVLGGNSRTVMILAVPPMLSCAQETLFSLQFASRARNIELGPAKRRVQAKNTVKEMQLLKDQLHELKQGKAKTESRVSELKKKLHITEQAMSAIKTEGTKKEDAQRKRAERDHIQVSKEVSEMRARLTAAKEAAKEAKADLEKEKRKAKAELKSISQEKTSAERKVTELSVMVEKQRQELMKLRVLASERESNSPTGAQKAKRRPSLGGGKNADISRPRTRASSRSSSTSKNQLSENGDSMNGRANRSMIPKPRGKS